jgi:hypothetical protein
MEPALPDMMVKRPETRMSDQVNDKVVEGWEQLPSDTGYDGKTTGSISRTGPPFNRPTNVAIGS